MAETTPAEAVAFAQQANGTTGLVPLECDHAVAVAYTPGHDWNNSHSNEPTAYQHWTDINARYPSSVHAGDKNAPAGALMFWQSGKDGHVAMSMGDGTVATTDMPGSGDYSIVPFAAFANQWGMNDYLGWTDPIFPNHGAGWQSQRVQNLFGTTGAGLGPSVSNPLSGATPGVTPSASSTPGTPTTAGRLGKIGLGLILSGLGVFLLFRKSAASVVMSQATGGLIDKSSLGNAQRINNDTSVMDANFANADRNMAAQDAKSASVAKGNRTRALNKAANNTGLTIVKKESA